MITLEEAEEAAADIDNRKIHKDTRSRYVSNLRAIKDFAAEKMKDCLKEDGELPCPLAPKLVSAFFGTLAKAGTEMDKLNDPSELKGDEEKPLSVSHLQGHGSAILYHYTENGKRVLRNHTHIGILWCILRIVYYVDFGFTPSQGLMTILDNYHIFANFGELGTSPILANFILYLKSRYSQ